MSFLEMTLIIIIGILVLLLWAQRMFINKFVSQTKKSASLSASDTVLEPTKVMRIFPPSNVPPNPRIAELDKQLDEIRVEREQMGLIRDPSFDIREDEIIAKIVEISMNDTDRRLLQDIKKTTSGSWKEPT